MKKNLSSPQLGSRLILAIKILVFPVLVLSIFYGCHKDNNAYKSSNVFQNKLIDSAYATLKKEANPEIFNDLNWKAVKINTLNNKPFLLQIPSIKNPAKQLFYNQINGHANTSWVQFQTGTDKHSGVLITSDLNQTKGLQSKFQSGKIFSTKNIAVNSNSGAAINSSDSESLTETNVDKSFSLDATDVNMFQPETEEDPIDPEDPTGGDPVAFSVMGPEFTITGTPITPEPTYYYSLYSLMNNNTAYKYQYTTDPNGAQASSMVVTPTSTSAIASAVAIADSRKPIDPKTYIKCFTDGKTASSYTITVYVAQPVPGSNDQWSLGEPAQPAGQLFKESDGTIIDVGHTFLGFTKTNTDGTSVTQVMGWYPGALTATTGVVKDDGLHPYEVSYSKTVSNTQFNAALNNVASDSANKLYILSEGGIGQEYNCTDAALKWAGNGGLSLPAGDSRGAFNATPGDFGQALRTLAGAKKGLFNAPASHGPCN